MLRGLFCQCLSTRFLELNNSAKKKTDIRPYTRQFYHKNGWCFALALLKTVVLTGANLLISWLLQQILDMVSGVDIGFSLGQMIFTAAICGLLVAAAYIFAYFSKPKFVSRAMEQYKNFVFGKLSQKGISAFSGENTTLYISALSNDAQAIANNYISNIFAIIDQSVMFAAALAMMFWYSPVLTVVSIALSLLPILASLLAGNRVVVAEKRFPT